MGVRNVVYNVMDEETAKQLIEKRVYFKNNGGRGITLVVKKILPGDKKEGIICLVKGVGTNTPLKNANVTIRLCPSTQVFVQVAGNGEEKKVRTTYNIRLF